MSSVLVNSNVLIHASKAGQEIMRVWLEIVKPLAVHITVQECLQQWKRIDLSVHQAEKDFLETFFRQAVKEGRMIDARQHRDVLLRGVELTLPDGPALKPNDALIAATAERFGLTLVTGDGRKNFVPRLRELNEQGKGNFKLKTYGYPDREATFARWIAELEL